MDRSETVAELAKSLVKFQAEVENASKKSVNPAFKSKYADLAEVLDTVRPVLAKYGFSVTQHPTFEEGSVKVETLLLHESGEWMSSTIRIPVTKQDAQGVGSAITYGRRYALASICGIAQEDDDANAASQKANKAPQKAESMVTLISWGEAERDAAKASVADLADVIFNLGATDEEIKAILAKPAPIGDEELGYQVWDRRFASYADRVTKTWQEKAKERGDA